jgi:hypothetical protein
MDIGFSLALEPVATGTEPSTFDAEKMQEIY